MEVLITGGAGFIGSHITRQLLEQGHNVTILDNLSRSTSADIDRRVHFVEADLAKDSDQKQLRDSLENVAAVIHMASLISVEESVTNPAVFIKNNVLGATNLLEAMKEKQVPKVVFSSSATVYGNSSNLPFREDAPTWAANPYGASKIAIEALLQSYNTLNNMDVVSLRYFNPYGPGENHQPEETHAIPNIIKSALADKPIPLYWGGQQVRDFIYVKDLAQAHIDVLKLVGYNVFNVGTGKGIKVIEVIDKVSKILGCDLKTVDLGQREGDVAASYANPELLQKRTSWRPKFSMEEGLKHTIDYFKNTP